MIEFGPNGMIEHYFASGQGRDQQERYASAYYAQLLGVRRGTCRSCKAGYVSGSSDIAGLCVNCLSASQRMAEAERTAPAPARLPEPATPGGREQGPEGIDGLDDWREADR